VIDFQRVLDAPVESDDVPEARTVRDYLVALLAKLWEDQEGFNGKRPFGNSGWDSDLIAALARAELIEGSFDEDGYLEASDDEAGEELIAGAIKHLGS
jgi:hypothetical protein